MRKFLLFDRHRKSNASPSNGIAPIAVSMPKLAAIRVNCHLDMPRLRASQIIYAPIAAVTRSPNTGTNPTIESSPNGMRVPGIWNDRSNSISNASTRLRTASGSRLIAGICAAICSNWSCEIGILKLLKTLSGVAAQILQEMPSSRIGIKSKQPVAGHRPAHRIGQRNEIACVL